MKEVVLFEKDYCSYLFCLSHDFFFYGLCSYTTCGTSCPINIF